MSDIVRLLRLETNRLCSAAADEIESRGEQLTEAAAFLDAMAERLRKASHMVMVDHAATDCRAMAKRLRGRALEGK